MKAIDKQFVDMYQGFSSVMGVDKTLLAVWANLYMEPGEITIDGLSVKTGYSIASISTKAKVLEQMGLIKKAIKPGSKKIYLSAEKNFLKVMKNHLLMKQEYMIKTIKKRMPTLIENARVKVKSQSDKKKLRILENYAKQISKIEKILHDTILELERA